MDDITFQCNIYINKLSNVFGELLLDRLYLKNFEQKVGESI